MIVGKTTYKGRTIYLEDEEYIPPEIKRQTEKKPWVRKTRNTECPQCKEEFTHFQSVPRKYCTMACFLEATKLTPEQEKRKREKLREYQRKWARYNEDKIKKWRDDNKKRLSEISNRSNKKNRVRVSKYRKEYYKKFGK